MRVRKHLGITQEALAERTGIPLSTLKKYEGSHSEPGAEALARMSKADINAYWLLSGQGPMLLTLSRIGHARDLVERFMAKRSGIPEHRVAEMMQAAFESDLDEVGVEREFGAIYPISPGVTVDAARLTLAIETVEKGLAQTGRPIDLPGRAELIATVYDMLTDPADPTRERILKLLKFTNL